MTKLPDVRYSARANARGIEIRAGSIAAFGNKFAAITDLDAVTPEEWSVLSDFIENLMKELQGEIESFVRKANYSVG